MLVRDMSNEDQLLIIERLVKVMQRDMSEYESVRDAIENTFDLDLEEFMDDIQVRVCDECGKVMTKGYCLGGGDEYHCSDECLHKNYSHNEWLAMYAGLDNTDPEEVERASKMSQAELDKLSEENDSQSYYTEWEI